MNSNQMPVSGGLAVVAAVIIGYFVIDAGMLEGSRPMGERLQIPQPHGIEDVQARLWQDPFAAAAEHRRQVHPERLRMQLQLSRVKNQQIQGLEPSFQFELKADAQVSPLNADDPSPHSLEQLANQADLSWWNLDNLDVLAVMVSAGPYPENSETRLRRRYAVIAGLAASGFQPSENTHIGYVDGLGVAYKDEDKKEKCGDNYIGEADLPDLMPFEWFKSREGRGILLLWLDEAAFAKAPLCKLNDLRRRFDRGDNFLIIGPHSSGTLSEMIHELPKDPPSKSNGQPELAFSELEGSFIYSATATAEPHELLGMNDSAKGVSTTPEAKDGATYEALDNTIARRFLDQHIIFFRSIANDRQLADALFKEIHSRLGTARGDEFNVALISEWDTLYGRSLPKSFSESAYQSINSSESKEEWVREHVFRFSYLRGIDGSVGGQSKEKKEEQASAVADNKEASHKRGRIETPQGRSQKDYLRRMAADIALTHQNLKNQGKKGIQAIGVLGSDVYDKLMILRALRKQFPKAIFFTTDLDAALMHPDQFPWSRNMLVASSFDLKIASNPDIRDMADNEGAQEGVYRSFLKATEWTVPQNRDVYQTSIFLSTVWATSPDIFGNLMKDFESQTKDVDDNDKKEEIAKRIITKKYIRNFKAFIQPRVYEIGRSGAIDLFPINHNYSLSGWRSPFYPVRVEPVSSLSVFKVAGSAVAFIFLMFLFWRRWVLVSDIKELHDPLKRKLHQADLVAAIISLAAGLVTWRCYYLDGGPDEVGIAGLLGVYVFLMLGYGAVVRRCIWAKQSFQGVGGE